MRRNVSAFAFFGGVPLSILYESTTLVVAQILGDGSRKRSGLFAGLQSPCPFEGRFGRPAKGNDKGQVEDMAVFARQTFMVLIQQVRDINDLNAMLLNRCRQAVLRGAEASIADRLTLDGAASLITSVTPFDARDKRLGQRLSQALIGYRNNDCGIFCVLLVADEPGDEPSGIGGAVFGLPGRRMVS